MRDKNLFLISTLSIIVCGCSVHPLPEDVTGLSVVDIVHQIQCEAAISIKDTHPDKGSIILAQKLKNLHEDIKNTKKIIEEAQAKLEAQSDYGVTGYELNDAIDSQELQVAQLQRQFENIPKPEIGTGSKRVDALRIEVRQLSKRSNKIIEMRDILNKISKNRKHIDGINQKINNKFKDTVNFESNISVFQFKFSITEDNNATANGTFKWPVVLGSLPGTFTLGYDIGDKKQRFSERTIKIAATFGELYRLECLGEASANHEVLTKKYPIQGSIGLDEVFNSYIDIGKNGKFDTGGESYTDTIRFTTSINGSIKPSVTLAKAGRTITAEADLTATRKDVHELKVFLTPPSSSKALPAQKVIITQMPAVRVRARVERQPPTY